MSLSKPINPPTINPALVKPVSTGAVFGTNVNRFLNNQIHGIAVNNTIGTGIPKQVTDVKVLIANAQTGATNKVTVLFSRDSTDTAFSGVNIWVKGYQGNPQLVQVSSGIESPCTFALNNTGETVVFFVQAFGNSGNSAISQAPSASGVLPKSTTGGFGSSSVIYYNVTNPPVTLPSGANTTDTIRWNEYGDNQWDVVTGIPRSILVVSDASAGPFTIGNGNGPAAVGNRTQFTATGTEFNGWTYTSAGASLNTAIGVWQGYGPTNGSYTFGTGYRFSLRGIIGSTSNCRYWLGLTKFAPGANATYSTDTPNTILVAFRFSSGTDSTIKAVTNLSNVSQTVVDTGVAVDTVNSHRFDITNVGNNSAFKFYIDGVLKATITRTLPATTDLYGTAFIADNKNTATPIVLTMFHSELMIK